jgi:hypothetical protein
VAVAVSALGVSLFVNGQLVAAVAVLCVAVVIVVANSLIERRWRRSTTAMVTWLIERAQYGTTYIQNATDHDIKSHDDIPRLVKRHDEWVAGIHVAASYLQPSDADELSMFHTYEPKGLKGLNAEHERILNWTAERVDRLKRVARRLQDGTTALGRYRPL